MAKKFEVKMYDIEDINPAAYNPRDISSLSFEGLKESLKKFGFVDPLIVNTRSGNLVGGHQRVKAAEAIGLTEVPVVEVDLSPSEEKALNVTLYNPNISGHYTDSLGDLLREIKLDIPPELFEALRLDELEPTLIDPSDDNGLDFVRKFEIIVTLKDENEQQMLFDDLTDKGFSCVIL